MHDCDRTEIIRGTTPTLIFTFSTIDVNNITTAYLTVKGDVSFEKDIDQAVKDENTLSWTLTQTETLSLVVNKPVTIYCDWVTIDGTRGRSKQKTAMVAPTGKEMVI